MAKTNVPVKEESGIKALWNRVRDYFSGVYNELKKVHWPNRRQIIVYTGVVLFVVALVSIILWLFDTGLSFLLNLLLDFFS